MDERLTLDGERRDPWPRLYLAGALFILLVYVLYYAFPARIMAMEQSYVQPLTAALAALYFYRRGLKTCREIQLMFAFAAWFFLTRLLNFDFYLEQDRDLVMGVLTCTCVMLPLYGVLDAKQRDKLLNGIMILAVGVDLLLAVVGLVTTLCRTSIHLPLENISIGLSAEIYHSASKKFYRLNLLEANPNTSAIWMFLGWCLLLHRFAVVKKKLWRIPLVLGMLVFYFAVAMTACRTIEVAMAVTMGMLAILLCLRFLDRKSRAVRLAAAVLLAALVVPLTYLSFARSVSLVSSAAEAYSARRETEEITVEAPTASEEAAVSYEEDEESPWEEMSFSDTRKQARDWKNLSSRKKIFSTFLPTLKARPAVLFLGSSYARFMEVANTILKKPQYSMHNSFLEAFLLTGVIGFALAAAFTVLLVWRMLRVFFSPQAPMELKLLTLPLAGLLIDSMLESTLFIYISQVNVLFFLLAGIFLTRSYELLPAGEKRERKKEKTRAEEDLDRELRELEEELKGARR